VSSLVKRKTGTFAPVLFPIVLSEASRAFSAFRSGMIRVELHESIRDLAPKFLDGYAAKIGKVVFEPRVLAHFLDINELGRLGQVVEFECVDHFHSFHDMHGSTPFFSILDYTPVGFICQENI
jgi:hypothetical protein